MDQKLSRSVQFLKGVGEKRAKLLEKLDIYTVFDLISHFPRDYEDRTQIKPIADVQPEETVCIQAILAQPVHSRRIRKGLEIARVRAVDETGSITLVFFNQGYLKDSLKPGETYIFYGKVSGNLLKKEMQNPTFEAVSEEPGLKTGRIIPIYPLTAGITRNILSKCMRAALDEYKEELTDPIPDSLRGKYKLAHAGYSYENIHFPKDFEALRLAKRRLVFEELFLFSTGIFLLNRRRQALTGCAFQPVDLSEFTKHLPYTLTRAQTRAIEEVFADLCSTKPMNRLIQGDVGSGKTIVAAACAFATGKNNKQTALMAPTEILAEQHYRSLSGLFEALGLTCALLTGSMTAAQKRGVKQGLQSGEIQVVIGTHALLTQDVAFADLGLVITDEQHRFGVRQRSELTSKGENPNLLVMSATPIPRTLALILYGDLDISIIDELPPGRLPVDTAAVSDAKRDKAYGFIRQELEKGRQAYIVCPLVEENQALELKSVEAFAETLKTTFSGFTVGFLHGRMKGKEKDAIMRDFVAGNIHVLVSTTVIEVGVNVPNATVMAVENAERFGLSQLHQLRGRVGRGEHKSYCILFSNSQGQVAKERMQVLCRTNDGFVISEEDLRLRGPGDFFGTRQHGVPEMKIADLAYNAKILKVAQEEAKALLADDPNLTNPEHAELANRIRKLFDKEVYGDIFN